MRYKVYRSGLALGNVDSRDTTRTLPEGVTLGGASWIGALSVVRRPEADFERTRLTSKRPRASKRPVRTCA